MSTAVQASPAPATGVVAYIRRVATSSLGAKIVMAVTGLGFYGWLIAHLIGNIAIFNPDHDKVSEYAALLHDHAALLWGQRAFLVVFAGLHILSGLRLAALNRAARPEAYAFKRWRRASLASRTMAISGIIVLVFIVFHLAHFTMHWVPGEYPNFKDPTHTDVFGMLTKSFVHAPIALFYTLAVTLVGLHLSHGFWSAFQSLGVNGKKWTPFASKLGLALAFLIAAGFASIPLAILFGAVR